MEMKTEPSNSSGETGITTGWAPLSVTNGTVWFCTTSSLKA